MDKLSPSMAQDGLAEFYESEKKKGNPLPLNSIQVIGLLEDTVNSKNNELKNYIHKSLRKTWINTLTRVIYNPGEKDQTIHNYGTSDAYSISGDIIGDENLIEKINNKNALESLLKTKNIEKLNKISNAINQTPMYFWRLNSKPSEKIENVVKLSSDVDRLNLLVEGYLSIRLPAFLVEMVE